MITGHLGLLVDLYQVSMLYTYWKNNMAQRKAVFNLYFRKAPYSDQYAIACGLGNVIQYIEEQREFWFDSQDLNYLNILTGNDEQKLFSREFLDFLGNMNFECSIDAIPEGTAVFPNEPLLRVSGPLYQCQLLESVLLNKINFSTLIATKAHRIVRAAQGDPVYEFGLRRAQGMGCLEASRATYIGGCAGTSNVLAGKIYNIPVKGTMAHSFVMSFESEQEAMNKWVESMPNNSILLVDTYDTIQGITNAINAGKKMRKENCLAGIRLDSGDLCELSKVARRMLDEAGFTNTKIIASNDLDEIEIMNLRAAGARIDAWGVGTNLITGGDQSSIGGIFKLAAIENEKGEMRDVMKISASDTSKSSLPGIQKVRRFKYLNGISAYDLIYDERDGAMISGNLIPYEDLLVGVYDAGKLVYKEPSLEKIRKVSAKSLSDFDWETTPRYTVMIDEKLLERKGKLLEKH